jgi:hypothetical protein
MTETVRGEDGQETVTVVDLAGEIDREDEAVRSQDRASRRPGGGR